MFKLLKSWFLEPTITPLNDWYDVVEAAPLACLLFDDTPQRIVLNLERAKQSESFRQLRLTERSQ